MKLDSYSNRGVYCAKFYGGGGKKLKKLEIKKEDNGIKDGVKRSALLRNVCEDFLPNISIIKKNVLNL